MQPYEHVLYVVLERTKGKLGWWKFPSLSGLGQFHIHWIVNSLFCASCASQLLPSTFENNHRSTENFDASLFSTDFPWFAGKIYNNSVDGNVFLDNDLSLVSIATLTASSCRRERDKTEKKRDDESISSSDSLSFVRFQSGSHERNRFDRGNVPS